MMPDQNELFEQFINECSEYDVEGQLDEIRETKDLSEDDTPDFQSVCDALNLTFVDTDAICLWMDEEGINY
jgi:hypothetical protein